MIEPFKNVRLSRNDFKHIGEFIHSRLGIKMPDSKRQMIESRLRKRLNALKLDSYSEYKKFLFSKQGMAEELHQFIDLVTTNKTDFFREPNHFVYLVEKAVPEITKSWGHSGRKLKIWSSACSRGDEPYTIAMVLSDYSDKYSDFDYSITASDISRKVLDIGSKGIYEEYVANPIPYPMRKKYLLRSKSQNRKLVRVVPELRNKINFKQLNLMNRNFGFRSKMDIIFCRNVIIYFDKETTYELIVKICSQLNKGGYLFMGHSEILDVKNLPLIPVASTVYKKV